MRLTKDQMRELLAVLQLAREWQRGIEHEWGETAVTWTEDQNLTRWIAIIEHEWGETAVTWTEDQNLTRWIAIMEYATQEKETARDKAR